MTIWLWLSVGALVAVVFVRVMLADSAYKEMSARLSEEFPLLGPLVFAAAALWAVLFWPLALGVIAVMLVRARAAR